MEGCCALSWVGLAVALLVVYKLVDTLLRWPRVNRLTDRYIVVTGCDTGFGHEIAKRLDSLGCHVFAGCLTEKGEIELRKACSDRLTIFSLDVTSQDSVRQAFNIVKDKLPKDQGLWGVLNNAGVLGPVGREEWLRIEDYRKTNNVNLLGVIDVTMTFLPLVKRSRGRIVNTASIVGRFVIPGAAPYCVSKYGVEAFTDGLRRNLRIYGCKAILIEPGYHRTHLIAQDNIQSLLTAAWNQATPEQQEEFGREYFDRFISLAAKSTDKVASFQLTDVVDAYEHALLGRFPRPRYVVGKDARFLWLPLQALPEWFSDWLLHRMNPDAPIPQAIKNRSPYIDIHAAVG